MDYLKQLIKNELAYQKISDKQKKLSLEVCEKEEDFTKNLSKNLYDNYCSLELEKNKIQLLEIERIIQTTITICKNIFK